MDNILNLINPFGKYQKLHLFLIGATSILTAMPIYSSIFILANPQLSCFHTNEKSENLEELNTCKIWINITNGHYKSNLSTESQIIYNENFFCKFDNKYYGLTLINEMGLVCDKKFYASLPQTIYMAGTFSSLFIGYFSDRFGRKSTMLLLTIFLCFNLTITESLQLKYFNLSSSNRFIIFLASQFLTGIAATAIYSISFILSLELTTSKYSTTASNIYLYMFIIGEFVVLFVAFFSRNWHIINSFTALYSLFMTFVIYCFIHESPRYLEQRKKYHEAYLIVKKIATFNGRQNSLPIEDEFITELIKKSKTDYNEKNIDEKKDLINDLTDKNVQKIEEKNNPKEKNVFIFILSSTKNVIQVILLVYIWFAVSLIYFGVSLGIVSVGHGTLNPYLMYLLSSVSEFVGYFSCHLNDKFGRKKMFVTFLGLSSIICLLVAVIPIQKSDKQENTWLNLNSILIIILTSVGKCGVSAAYSSLYIYACQLFPTSLRNTLVLFISSVGRFGSIISPFINLLGPIFWQPAPYIIFSCGALLACIFVMILSDPAKLNYL